eukprot:14455108-Ditylum_brightwellii.AAC.1
MASKATSLPKYTKGGRLVGSCLGRGDWGNKKNLAVCCWVYFDPVIHSKSYPSPRHNSSYLWESTAKLLLDS